MAAAVGLGIGFLAATLHQTAHRLPTTTDLSPRPAGAVWAPIEHFGQPPSDVLNNLVIPQIAVSTGYDNLDANAGQYDRSATFFVASSTSDVLGFYNVELPGLGWKLRGSGPTRDHRGTILLAYRFSQDSFTWQVQISVEPVTRAGGHGTKLTVEAYQQTEDES